MIKKNTLYSKLLEIFMAIERGILYEYDNQNPLQIEDIEDIEDIDILGTLNVFVHMQVKRL